MIVRPLIQLLLVAVAALVLIGCQEPVAEEERGNGSVVVDGLGVVELIELLAHPNEQVQTRARLQLNAYLIDGTDDVDYAERLTRFHKFAPHACKAGHEAQTLHILELFAAQEDVSSILVKQCLASPKPRVRAKGLEVAHFSDNDLEAELLQFEPDAETLASYKFALEQMGTPRAEDRLETLEER